MVPVLFSSYPYFQDFLEIERNALVPCVNYTEYTGSLCQLSVSDGDIIRELRSMLYPIKDPCSMWMICEEWAISCS